MKKDIEIQEIKRHGLTFYEKATEQENESYNIGKELVENLFFDMSKLSTKYCNEIFCDLPFMYSERPVDSVLLPVLSKLCNSLVLVELPVTRKKLDFDESSGRIDYWCIYKNYSIVIELKHSFDCFTTSKTRERKVTKRWNTMIEQLISVKDDVKQFGERTKGIVRLGLNIITSYSDKYPDKELLVQFKNGIPDTFERLSKDVNRRFPSKRPDLVLCWKIPNRIVYSYDQTFPGLWALAKIYPPITHQGAIK